MVYICVFINGCKCKQGPQKPERKLMEDERVAEEGAGKHKEKSESRLRGLGRGHGGERGRGKNQSKHTVIENAIMISNS